MSDITSGIEVGIEPKATLTTAVARAVSIPFIDVTTIRTLLRRVTSIDEQNRLADGFGFIPQELFKLIKSPRVDKPVELSTPSFLHSDLTQVFERIDSKGQRNKFLTNTVVNVSHKPSFPFTHTLKLALSGTGAFGLKLCAKVSILPSHVLNLLSIEKRVIRTDSDVFDSAVDAKNCSIVTSRHISRLHRDVQVKPFAIRERNAFQRPPQIPRIARRNRETRFDATGNGSDRRKAFVDSDTSDTMVVPHSRTRLLLWKRFAFISLERFTSAVSRTLHERRWKRRSSTKLVIRSFVILNLIPRMVIKAPLRRSVERFGVLVHRGKELLNILVGTMQLEGHSAYHVHILGLIDNKGYVTMEKVKGGQVRSPLPAIAGSLRPEFR